MRSTWPLILIVLGIVAPSGGCSRMGPDSWTHSAVQRLAAIQVPAVVPTSKPIKIRTELPQTEAGEVCVATAIELQTNGHAREAILLLERARELNPKQAVAHRLAVLYDQGDDPIRARSEYQKALASQPNDPQLLNDVGYFHYRQGDFAEAEKYLRRAADKSPETQRAWVNLGLALGEQQKYDESLAAFEKGVGSAAAQSNLGVIYVKHDRLPQAIESFERALKQEPNLRQARVFLERLTAVTPR